MDAALQQHLQALELRLLQPQVRASAEQLERLLDADFIEFGASGRRYQRQQIIAALVAEPELEIQVRDFECVPLAPGLVQLRYISRVVRDGVIRQAWRSSIWRCADDGWRILFHQGTAFAE
jgi:hypothetical protein